MHRKQLITACFISLFMFTLAACGSTSTNTGTATNTGGTSPTSAPTTAPTQQQRFKVGQAVTFGNTWQVTLNSAKTSQGDQYLKPKSGNTYIILDVTLKNISTEEKTVSSALNFAFQDSTGQKYTETFLTGNTAPDGKVEPNSLLRGQLVYEVPKSQHNFTLSFQADITSPGQTIWDVTA